MINKDGLEIEMNPRRVMDELLRGTGAVMADGVSIYVENTNVRDHQIVVARSPESGQTVERKYFEVQGYDQAWVQFTEWMNPD